MMIHRYYLTPKYYLRGSKSAEWIYLATTYHVPHSILYRACGIDPATRIDPIYPQTFWNEIDSPSSNCTQFIAISAENSCFLAVNAILVDLDGSIHVAESIAYSLILHQKNIICSLKKTMLL